MAEPQSTLPGIRKRRPAPFLRRVQLGNYRSIPACDVELGPLTFLVGPNGAGKSNFLDALRLIVDALRTSLDHALRDRGSVREVRRRSAGHPTHFSIRIDFQLEGEPGHFAFEIGAEKDSFFVKTEECAVGDARYRVENGTIKVAPAAVSPPAANDRLYLVNAAGLPAFRPVFDVLSNMGFYSLNPDKIRGLQAPDKGELLARDGFNLASVLERLQKIEGGSSARRINEYMGKIVPGLIGVVPKRVEHMETLEFLQEAGTAQPWKFPAINMSDGTLRALGVLVALLQAQAEPKIRVVGIEEPESALHPAAAGVLRDALREASRSTQVLVTSHSPELLDDRSIVDHELVSVSSEDGETQIAPLDESSRYALRERLYTGGGLLRANQLFPDRSRIPRVDQLDLFEVKAQ